MVDLVNSEAKFGKHDVVKALQEDGVKVAHFGNGGNDRQAVEQADEGLRQRSWRSKPKEAYRWALQEGI